MVKSRQIWSKVLLVALVVITAMALRWRAVQQLPIDYDEDDYLRAGQQYATGLQNGDLGVFTRENYRTEHPPLTKIVTGLVLWGLPAAPEIPDRDVSAAPASSLPQPHLTAARSASALENVLAVLLLALLDPLAGLFLAIHSFTIKYTSQVMLESLPVLTSLGMVLAYLRSRRKPGGWLLLSAVLLGLTAASKVPYCLAGLAVAVDWLAAEWDALRAAGWKRLLPLAGWGALALLVFFAADPYLWPDPIGRLSQSLLYHGGYAQSAAVKSAGLPPWQPLVWLFMSVPWHPGVLVVGLDVFISFAALFGLRRLGSRWRVFLLWLVFGLGFLLVWPTKWPQYILMIVAPLCLAGAEGFRALVVEPLRVRSKATEQPGGPYARRQVWLWLLPGLIGLGVITLFPLLFQLAMALTDFSSTAIRDGIHGGVWREVWLGLTAQVQPVTFELFSSGGVPKVHYAGLNLLLNLFQQVQGDLLVFELLWTLASVSLQMALGVGVALILNRRGVWLKGWWQALFILPWAIPEFVGALTWFNVFEPRYGWLSLAAASWSQTAPAVVATTRDWMSTPLGVLGVLLTANTWYGFPFMLVSAAAGLKLLPGEVYDAAALDGASGWHQFRLLTWPLLFPLLAPAIILRAIFAFNQFYLFIVMQVSPPLTTLATLSYYIFGSNMRGQYAISAAVNIVTVAVLIFLVLLFNRQSRATEGVTYA